MKRAATSTWIDDNAETAKKRFKQFNDECAQVIEIYDSWGMLREIDGSGTIDECYKLTKASLKLN